MSGPTFLGDSHNFGRRVSVHAGRVAKPRALLWEWLLLAAESPLRRFLNQAGDAFEFLPELDFWFSAGQVGGEVAEIVLQPLGTLSSDEKHSLAAIVGRSLALFGWLGVADLHWENLVLGRDHRGRMVFGPLDVEIILADMSLPTETKLLPDADPEYAEICRHACGVRRALPFLGKPIEARDLLAMAGGYQATLAFLDRHARAIAKIISDLPGLRETPIRVCLRGTGDYLRAGSDGFWPPLLDAEREQLERGDIPYFFRLYGKKGIHYYGEETLSELQRIPLEGDVPQLDPILDLARGLRSSTRTTLREQGLFTVIGAFDHPSLTGRHQSSELEVALRARTVLVKLANGEELETRRDLSAFVSSVYQSCHCGEVQTVFVPAVTVCESG